MRQTSAPAMQSKLVSHMFAQQSSGNCMVQAGARKVYAVEASGMAKYARQLVAASGKHST